MPALGSILGSLLGLGGSVIPSVIDVYDKKQQRQHEQKLKQLELDAAKLGHEFTYKGQELVAQSAETTALLAHDTSLATENKFLQFVRASVRPFITYLFFGLFLAVKLSALYVAFFVQAVPLAPALLALWDGDTAALFATIMGFWFGNRAIEKFGFANSNRGAVATLSSKPISSK